MSFHDLPFFPAGGTAEAGATGDAGYSPTITTSKSGKVTTISITDKDGTKTAKINDGADGTSVTISKVAESATDGGENVVTFSDGKTLKVKNGNTGKAPEKGVDYFDGEDGYSPSVNIKKSGKATTISITDKNGTKSETVNDGVDGTSVTITDISETAESGGENKVTFSDGKTITIKNGQDGRTPLKGTDYFDGNDGFSPSITVDKSEKITTITIKNKTETKTVTIDDGENGTSVTVTDVSENTEDGGSNVVTFSDGKTLTVKNGSAGKTPVKGTDYWTEADKAEIIAAILAEINPQA